MDNLALTKSDYKILKKKINTRYGNHVAISTEDIIQDAFLKLLERGDSITDYRYVMNTAKYVTFNAVKTYRTRLALQYVVYLCLHRDTKSGMGHTYSESIGNPFFKQEEQETTLVATRHLICLTTGEVFKTSVEAAKAYNISPGMISKHLKGQKKSAGKYNGIPLVWDRLKLDISK